MKSLTIEQMDNAMCGYSGKQAACDVLMATAGGIWGAAVGVATGGIGAFVFGVAWAPFQGWVCSHVTE